MIVVVGAGATGLALGLELDRQGERFIVLEASDRPGGVIRSAEISGRIVDWGPQRLRLTPRIRDLVANLGLQDELLVAPSDLELFVYRDGKLRAVPFTPWEFLTTDAVSLGAKLRIFLEPFTSGAVPEEDVATYFRRKFGDEAYEAIIGPLYGGLYGSDPADMRIDLSLIRVLEHFGIERSLLLSLLRRGGRISPPAACSFRDGMETLPSAMASALGRRLRLGTPVESVRASSGGWRLELPGESVLASQVVLTTPAPVTSGLLLDAAPQAAEAIGSLRYNSLAAVHLDADTDLRGLGFQVSFTERDRVLRGVTFNDSLFDRKNLYTAYLGGARNPEIANMGEQRLAELAVDEFRRCTSYEASAISVEVERIPAWDRSWAALRGMTLPPGMHIAANWWSRPGIPGRLTEAAEVARRLVESNPVAPTSHVARYGT